MVNPLDVLNVLRRLKMSTEVRLEGDKLVIKGDMVEGELKIKDPELLHVLREALG